MPVREENISAMMWLGVPMPGVALLSPPVFDLPMATRSATFFAGLAVGTTRMLATEPMMMMGTKSLIGS